MILALVACSASQAPPPPVLAPAAAPVSAAEGGGSAPVPGAAEPSPSLLGISPPPPRPAPPPNATLCPEWAGEFKVPGRLSVVDCSADRVALTGPDVLVDACASVRVGLKDSRWEAGPEVDFRSVYTKDHRQIELVCVEVPRGVLLTLTVID